MDWTLKLVSVNSSQQLFKCKDFLLFCFLLQIEYSWVFKYVNKYSITLLDVT